MELLRLLVGAMKTQRAVPQAGLLYHPKYFGTSGFICHGWSGNQLGESFGGFYCQIMPKGIFKTPCKIVSIVAFGPFYVNVFYL